MPIFLAVMLLQATAERIGKPPLLVNRDLIIKPEDYPLDALRHGDFGIVSVVLRVSPKGKVSSCAVTETTGFPVLDAKTCSLLRLRAKFDPAIDGEGNPIEGEYRGASTWGVDANQPCTSMEVSLSVKKLPSQYVGPMKARIIFSETGRVTICETTLSSGSKPADLAICSYVKTTSP